MGKKYQASILVMHKKDDLDQKAEWIQTLKKKFKDILDNSFWGNYFLPLHSSK